MVLSMNWLSDFVDCSDIDIKKDLFIIAAQELLESFL